MVPTVMSVKTDKELKEKAQKIAKEMGFSLGTLVNAFLRQFVKSKTVYFTIAPTENMSEAMEKELGTIEKNLKKELNLSPQFENMKDALNYLKKA
jgi:addiction module RelB/DinJ family antitoxin